MNQVAKLSELIKTDKVKEKFDQILGERAPQYMSSMLQIVNNNSLLKKADPITVLNAVATAAILDLPINPNLGYAWIVPYKGEAQFQIGWKGFVQLALRTGQYKALNVVEVYENQFTSFNSLTEDLVSDFSLPPEGKIIAYAAYLKLTTGFEKTVFWTKEKVTNHAKKYSQAYGKTFSPWSDPVKFIEMAKKTVLKNMISKWGIMSIEMQTAHLSDQSVQKEENDYEYPDNNTVDSEVIDLDVENAKKELDRAKAFIEKAKDIKALQKIENQLAEEGKDAKEILELIESKKALFIDEQIEA